MSDNTYERVDRQIDMEDLAIVVMIEWDTATCIRLSFEDYHHLGHPQGVVSSDNNHWLAVEPRSDVPRGTIDAPPPEITKPHTGHLSRLIARIAAKLRRES